MNARSRALLLALLVGGSAATKLSSDAIQQRGPLPQRIKHRIACPQCAIEFTRVAAFDTAARVPMLGSPPAGRVARDSKGRLFTSNYGRDQVLVFEPDGRFIAAFGRKGDGPGEFGTSIFGVQRVEIGRGDSIYVFHTPATISVFTPAFVYVRAVSLRGEIVDYFPLPSGDILLHARIRTPEQVGHPLHMLSPSGSILRSFGAENRPVGRGQASQLWQEFAVSTDKKSVWLGRGRSYRLKRLSFDGTVLQDFELYDVPWLDSLTPITATTPLDRIPATSVLEFAGIDSVGLIWINGRSPRGMRGATRMYERTIEVFDPRTGELLVSQRTEAELYVLPATNLAFSVKQDENDFYRYTIWRMRLRRG